MTTRPDKEELASRGKKAEAAVQKFLARLKMSEATFDFQRQYDARSARGRFQAQVGDYLIFRRFDHMPLHGILEVKQVHHDHRLPGKNFNAEQIAKMRRRLLSGGVGIVVIFHTTTQLWRLPSFGVFSSEPDAASWDLSDSPTYTDVRIALVTQYPEFFA